MRFWFRVRTYCKQHFVQSQQTNHQHDSDDVIGVVTRTRTTVTPTTPSASLPVARPTVNPLQPTPTTAADHDDEAAADMQSSNNNNNDQSSFSSSDTDLDFHDSDSRRRRLFKAARARNCSTIRPAVGNGGRLHDIVQHLCR